MDAEEQRLIELSESGRYENCDSNEALHDYDDYDVCSEDEDERPQLQLTGHGGWEEDSPEVTALDAAAQISSRYFLPLDLEDRTLETECFSVESFRKSHGQRVRYVPHESDVALLNEGKPLSEMVGALLPLRADTSRHALPEGPAPAPAAVQATTSGIDGVCALVPSGAPAEEQSEGRQSEGQSGEAGCSSMPRGGLAPGIGLHAHTTSAPGDYGLPLQAEKEHPLLSKRPLSELERAPKRRFELIYRNYAPPPPPVSGPSLPLGAVLLRVAFYDRKRKASEWVVHGDQRLIELRQCLQCRSLDQLHYQQKKLQQSKREELPLPSDAAFFFIEGRFFSCGAPEPTEHIREWICKSHSSEDGGVSQEELRQALRPRPMAETSFEMLRLRLGRQYLFSHLGDCEHAIIFLDCWLATPADELRIRAYPLLVWLGKRSPPMCCVCARAPADWEVHGDTQADSTPNLLCKQCHFQFHYDADGQLRSRHKQFRVVPEGSHPTPCAQAALQIEGRDDPPLMIEGGEGPPHTVSTEEAGAIVVFEAGEGGANVNDEDS